MSQLRQLRVTQEGSEKGGKKRVLGGEGGGRGFRGLWKMGGKREIQGRRRMWGRQSS